MSDLKTCIICNKLFKTRGNKKTCSDECSKINEKVQWKIREKQRCIDNILNNNSKKIYKLKCHICENEFETNQPNQTICGKELCKKIRAKKYYKNHKKDNDLLTVNKKVDNKFKNIGVCIVSDYSARPKERQVLEWVDIT